MKNSVSSYQKDWNIKNNFSKNVTWIRWMHKKYRYYMRMLGFFMKWSWSYCLRLYELGLRAAEKETIGCKSLKVVHIYFTDKEKIYKKNHNFWNDSKEKTISIRSSKNTSTYCLRSVIFYVWHIMLIFVMNGKKNYPFSSPTRSYSQYKKKRFQKKANRKIFLKFEIWIS